MTAHCDNARVNGQRITQQAGRRPDRVASRTAAHCRAMPARRRLSSVSRFARPSPRARSRVACTVSRTPGSRSSTPSRSTSSSVHLAADSRLERDDLLPQLRFGGGGHPQRQRRTEQRAGEQRRTRLDDRRSVRRSAGPTGQLRAHLLAAHPRHVLQRGREQRLAGREVVLRRAARHPGALGDHRHRGRRPAQLGQAGDRRLEQPRRVARLRSCCGSRARRSVAVTCDPRALAGVRGTPACPRGLGRGEQPRRQGLHLVRVLGRRPPGTARVRQRLRLGQALRRARAQRVEDRAERRVHVVGGGGDQPGLGGRRRVERLAGEVVAGGGARGHPGRAWSAR